ncbi:lytic murein transglycosylase [Porticoccus sp.]|uniref:lytic murein transglycosylase n=1 Tax=Porticoccus sp. TaxID=2024853 RepID=UPI0025D88CBA|nr:lytic murein transglycosylase [Porticoccus sp.]
MNTFAVRRHFVVILALGALAITAPSSANTEFSTCLMSLQAQARSAGINESILRDVVPSLQQQERVISLDRKQPEFLQTFSEYLDLRVTPERVERGRALLEKYRSFLLDLQEQYGVPPQYLVSFWGLETNYGSYLGRMPTLDSLATLACDQRRSDFFSGEFIAALQLMQRESLESADMQGSWAGAVGHTQFMPSSYLRYAVDGDGDGQIDLWRSERDALASGANYLKALGWQSGLRWGREVQLPDNFPFQFAGQRDQRRPLHEWAAHGVRLNDGGKLPNTNIDAALLVPAGHRGPAFLIYDNFDIIMRWNRSELYAIAVGHLADRIAGAGALRNGTNVQEPLRKTDIELVQETLNAIGYDAGPVDGVLGSATRSALREFQLANNMVADGYPNPSTLEAIATHDRR